MAPALVPMLLSCELLRTQNWGETHRYLCAAAWGAAVGYMHGSQQRSDQGIRGVSSGRRAAEKKAERYGEETASDCKGAGHTAATPCLVCPPPFL